MDIIHADKNEYNREKYGEAQNLIGNVQLRHEGIMMFCNQAQVFRNENRVLAKGNVKISQGDTLFVWGEEATYDGNKKHARVDGQVKLENKDFILTAPQVEFDRKNQIAYYNKSGEILSKGEGNTLSSKKGWFYIEQDQFIFNEKVVLDDPEYQIYTDTMHFNTENEIAHFFGPTTILSDSNNLYSNKGYYNTKTDIASFSSAAKLERKGSTLSTDSIYYNRNSGLVQAFQHVVLHDSINNWLLLGSYGEFHEKKDSAFFPNNPVVKFSSDGDTLYMTADSIFLSSHESEKKLKAFRKVRFFKSDIQGVCDSLFYTKSDSTLRMRDNPVLWSENNQITGKTIDIIVGSGGIYSLNIPQESFVVQQVDTARYNQVKGRKLKGIFQNNELKTILVTGNGQTIYYVIEENADTNTFAPDKLIGIYKTDCSNIRIDMKEGKIRDISFLTKPNTVFHPPADENTQKFVLKGMYWVQSKRPKTKEDILLFAPKKMP